MERVIIIKINEITTDFLVDYCNAYAEDKPLFEVFKDASISYIRSYSGLTDEKINEMDDLTIAFLVLIDGYYNNRSITVDKDTINPILDGILALHDNNLL